MLRILYQDADLIAIAKPSGLLVHRSEIDHHETANAVDMLRAQTGLPVNPVHRLDKPTSGILLFACHRDAAVSLAAQFAGNSIDKRYLALVRGWPADSVHLNHPLARIEDDYARVGRDSVVQEAITDFRTLARCELPVAVDKYPVSRYALVEARPHTGRQHQIRRHLKHLAHPIIGDVRYGKGTHNRFFRERYGAQRLLLACTGLSFRHPVSGVPLDLHCPVDGEFAAVCAALGFPEYGASGSLRR